MQFTYAQHACTLHTCFIFPDKIYLRWHYSFSLLFFFKTARCDLREICHSLVTYVEAPSLLYMIYCSILNKPSYKNPIFSMLAIKDLNYGHTWLILMFVSWWNQCSKAHPFLNCAHWKVINFVNYGLCMVLILWPGMLMCQVFSFQIDILFQISTEWKEMVKSFLAVTILFFIQVSCIFFIKMVVYGLMELWLLLLTRQATM